MSRLWKLLVFFTVLLATAAVHNSQPTPLSQNTSPQGNQNSPDKSSDLTVSPDKMEMRTTTPSIASATKDSVRTTSIKKDNPESSNGVLTSNDNSTYIGVNVIQGKEASTEKPLDDWKSIGKKLSVWNFTPDNNKPLPEGQASTTTVKTGISGSTEATTETPLDDWENIGKKPGAGRITPNIDNPLPEGQAGTTTVKTGIYGSTEATTETPLDDWENIGKKPGAGKNNTSTLPSTGTPSPKGEANATTCIGKQTTSEGISTKQPIGVSNVDKVEKTSTEPNIYGSGRHTIQDIGDLGKNRSRGSTDVMGQPTNNKPASDGSTTPKDSSSPSADKAMGNTCYYLVNEKKLGMTEKCPTLLLGSAILENDHLEYETSNIALVASMASMAVRPELKIYLVVKGLRSQDLNGLLDSPIKLTKLTQTTVKMLKTNGLDGIYIVNPSGADLKEKIVSQIGASHEWRNSGLIVEVGPPVAEIKVTRVLNDMPIISSSKDREITEKSILVVGRLKRLANKNQETTKVPEIPIDMKGHKDIIQLPGEDPIHLDLENDPMLQDGKSLLYPPGYPRPAEMTTSATSSSSN